MRAWVCGFCNSTEDDVQPGALPVGINFSCKLCWMMYVSRQSMSCCTPAGVSVWKNKQWVCNDCGTIKPNDLGSLNSARKVITSTTGCKHEFVKYTGLNETFEFCKVCDVRR